MLYLQTGSRKNAKINGQRPEDTQKREEVYRCCQRIWHNAVSSRATWSLNLKGVDDMARKRITVVGAGALGSHLVMFMRNMDCSITVIDMDRVEQKNTQSQFHPKNTVRKNKVQALQQTMQFLWGIKVDTIPHKLVEDNQNQLLAGADLIVDCLDNGDARRLVQRYVRANKVPCVHGALAADGNFGLVKWDDTFTIDDEPESGAATCEAGEHLPFISIVSGILARSVQEFLFSGTSINFLIYPLSGAVRV
jgi:molybdopterin-synthase adenylyltransferase